MKKLFFAALLSLPLFAAQQAEAQNITVNNTTPGNLNFQIDAMETPPTGNGGSTGMINIPSGGSMPLNATSFSWSMGTLPAVYELFAVTIMEPCPIGQNCVVGSGGLNCFRIGNPIYSYPTIATCNIASSCYPSGLINADITWLPGGDMIINFY